MAASKLHISRQLTVLWERKWAKLLSISMALLFLQCWSAEAAGPNCIKDYHRTKSADCVDSLLSHLRTAPPSESNPATVVGFLAQLFSQSPEEKRRLLARESSNYVRYFILIALYRAGLLEDAKKVANDHNLSAMLQKIDAARPAPLVTTKPSSDPQENDVLIGAYMASGDTTLIKRILGNFAGLDDETLSDALRMGLMISKFGPTLTPEGRENVMPKAACAKYQCKRDPSKAQRLITLSMAFWAVKTLGQQDNGVRKTFNRFFENDPRRKKLLAIEQVAFGNYLTALVIIETFKPDQPGVNPQTYEATVKEALAYENLEPALTVFKPPNKSGPQQK